MSIVSSCPTIGCVTKRGTDSAYFPRIHLTIGRIAKREGNAEHIKRLLTIVNGTFKHSLPVN